MATIRRIYLYAVLFVSLMMFVWGGIGVLNLLLSLELGERDDLASSLSIMLVAAPIFALHWWLAGKGGVEETRSRTRAFFLYAALLALTLPVIQNGMLLVERLLLQLFGLPSWRTILFGQETWTGAVSAIAVNLLAAAFFYRVVHRTWQEMPAAAVEFFETRRLYRYLWLFISLFITVAGIHRLLFFSLTIISGFARSALAEVAVGLALIAGGAPLWYAWDRHIRSSLNASGERLSVIRLVALYVLVLVGALLLLIWATTALGELFAALLAPLTLASVFSETMSFSLALLLAFTPFWVRYQRILKNTIVIQGSQIPDRSNSDITLPSRRSTYLPRQAAMLRGYTYFMALLGLVASIAGILNITGALIRILFSASSQGQPLLQYLRTNETGDWLTTGLATLIAGVPLWLYFWRPQIREAVQEGEAGEHTRRSLVRKIYLYLLLFASVIGSMTSAGQILYMLLQALLGQPDADALSETLLAVRVLVVLGGVGLYHGLWLRSDLRLAGSVLARRHAQFPVLVLTPEPLSRPSEAQPAPDPDGLHTAFGETVVAALQRRAPSLPVAVHPSEEGAPDETLSAARAVIVPAGLLAKPPEGLRLWLQGYKGARVVIPTPAPDWYWISRGPRSLETQARQAANLVGQLAEGDEISAESANPFWQILVYAMAALFLLQLVLVLIMIFANAFIG
jgi:hypothetical protein